MRRAKFLGVIDDIGCELKEVSMGGYRPGAEIVVFFNTGNATFPWRDSELEDINATYFRAEELSFATEKEFDPNDYL